MFICYCCQLAIDDYCCQKETKKTSVKPSRQPILVFADRKAEADKKRKGVDESGDGEQKKPKLNEEVRLLDDEPDDAQEEKQIEPIGGEAPSLLLVGSEEEKHVRVEQKIIEKEKQRWNPAIGDTFWVKVIVDEVADDDEFHESTQPASAIAEGGLFWSGTRVHVSAERKEKEAADEFITARAVGEAHVNEYKVYMDLCVPCKVSERIGNFLFVLLRIS